MCLMTLLCIVSQKWRHYEIELEHIVLLFCNLLKLILTIWGKSILYTPVRLELHFLDTVTAKIPHYDKLYEHTLCTYKEGIQFIILCYLTWQSTLHL